MMLLIFNRIICAIAAIANENKGVILNHKTMEAILA